MLERVNATPLGPTGSARRRRGLSASWGARTGACRPDDAVSDEQIREFVAVADRLGQRQRAGADSGSAAAEERLRNLDWAVRAGRRALAERAARGPTSTARSARLPWERP